MTVLLLEDVTKTFSTDPLVRPLDHVSLAVEAGEVVAITGNSGNGKSTLLNVAGGLMHPDEGRVLVNGNDLFELEKGAFDALHACGIGTIFQSPRLFAALTAEENVTFALRLAGQPCDAQRVAEVLEGVGLEDRADCLPHELSTGQQRRLMFARVLAVPHALVLADEPTNDLDAVWADEVLKRLRAFASGEGRSVVIVTHDVRGVHAADRVLELSGGVLRAVEE